MAKKLCHQIVPPPTADSDAASKEYTDDLVVAVAENVRPIDQGAVDSIRFVRPAGNDTTGDGLTTGTAWATLSHALAQVDIYAVGVNNIIDISTMGTINDEFELPQVRSPNLGDVDVAGGPIGFLFSALTIRADLDVQDTITGGEIVSQTPAAVTGFRTILTTKTFTPGALVGLTLASDTTRFAAPIVANTADSIVVPINFDLTAPLEIADYGAKIEANGRAAIAIQSVPCRVTLAGLHLTNLALTSALEVNATDFVQLSHCRIDGAILTQSRVSARGCQFDSKDLFFQNLTESSFSSVFFNGTELDFRSAPGGNFFSSIWAEGCTPFGASPTVSDFSQVVYEIDRAEIKDPVDEGILVRNNSTARILRAHISGAGDDAVLVEKGASARLVDVHRPAGGAANAGYGVQVRHNAHCQVDSLTDVDGTTGEIKVGDNAGTTWAAFRTGPPNDEVDATTHLARLYEL